MGHRRRMISAPASAQSASRLPGAGQSEITSIVTVGAPLATLACSQDRTREKGLHLRVKISTGKRITPFDWTPSSATISRLIAESSLCNVNREDGRHGRI